MLKQIFYTLSFIFCSLHGYSINADVNLATFLADDQPYVELYLHFDASSLNYKIRDNEPSAVIEVLIIFESNGNIISADKYKLKSNEKVDFYDVKRYALENGEYQLRVELDDKFDPDGSLSTSRNFTLNYPIDKMGISDIAILSKAEQNTGEGNIFKHGFLLEPLAAKTYPNSSSTLLAFAEIYQSNTHFEGPFAISYKILNEDGSAIGLSSFKRYQKLNPADVIPLILRLNIEGLTPGKYKFQIEILEAKDKIVMSKQIIFKKQNPQSLEFINLMNEEQLNYALRSLMPLIHQEDTRLLNKMLKRGELEEKKSFLKKYWVQAYPEDTEKMYALYTALLDEVHDLFYSGFGYGFETDRGRIYIKYGKPNDIIRIEDDPIAYPYEIWTYENLPGNGQSNVKFLFYNEHLAGNGFRLLHSTAIGEYSNPRWEIELYSNAPDETAGDNYHDATRMKDGYNRRARQLMEGG